MLCLMFRAGMEDVLDAQDDEHGKHDVSKNDEDCVTEIPEGTGFQQHVGHLVNRREDEGVKENPPEILDTGHWAVDVFELDVIASVQPFDDIRTEEHHQRARERTGAEGVRKGIHHEASDETDNILHRKRQLQRQEEQSQKEQSRIHIPEKTNMLANGNLHHQQNQESQDV